MTYDNKPTNSSDSAPTEVKDQNSSRSPDIHSERSEQIIDESSGSLEIQGSDEPDADPSSLVTSSLEPSGSIPSHQNTPFSPLNNSTGEDETIANGLIRADLSEEISECRHASRSSSKIPLPGETPPICYNPVLDDEIRARLDKLNGLSDLINSLELQFDQANTLFNETLKCSTEKLSSIAKSLGPKSIRKGRLYHAAKISVEQTQSECQRACVQFEQANIDHQHARLAIKEAESKLFDISSACRGELTRRHEGTPEISSSDFDISRLELRCDSELEARSELQIEDYKVHKEISPSPSGANLSNDGANEDRTTDPDTAKLMDSTKLSEDLNRAIIRLVEAEEKRLQSEKLHLNQANKLMIAQENLTKLEREHGPSIRRAQVYFEEARRFNAKLNSVKSDITRLTEGIVAAKKSYAKTLNELEQFSENLRIHINGSSMIDSKAQNGD